MKVERFLETIGASFYVGVPDSQLKQLCNYLYSKYGIDSHHHIIAANEGNAVAIASGYYLATQNFPVVYLQNSGEGNIVNPVASLTCNEVYGIPIVYVIGWRGEPGMHDEPQHVYQGKITKELLSLLDIDCFVVDKSTTDDEIRNVMSRYKENIKNKKSVAFIIKKDAFDLCEEPNYSNSYTLKREIVIEHILKVSEKDPIVSTTGKTSRELYELRDINGDSHKYDFLTVGSMGHSSSIALGIALSKKDTKIWCVDGDGAVLMHMGSMALIGHNKPKNFVHVVINNCSHESVGGMPTVSSNINFVNLAQSVGYQYAASVDNINDLDIELRKVKDLNELCFLEIKCAIGSRSNLGRPKISPIENKNNFISYLDSV